MVTIQEYTHKIDERLSLLRDTPKDGLRVRIRLISSSDEPYYFDPSVNHFVALSEVLDEDSLWLEFSDFQSSDNLKTLNIVTLPTKVQDLLFEYQSFDYTTNPDYPATSDVEFIPDPSTIEDFYERHIFGGPRSVAEPSLCNIYGTLKDVSGKPLSGQKVEAYLNRAGFFTHKAGLIGYAATTLTDDTGYFELPLVVGLDVTINIPIVGFTTRGFVPNLDSTKLTTQTLLSYSPGY